MKGRFLPDPRLVERTCSVSNLFFCNSFFVLDSGIRFIDQRSNSQTVSRPLGHCIVETGRQTFLFDYDLNVFATTAFSKGQWRRQRGRFGFGSIFDSAMRCPCHSADKPSSRGWVIQFFRFAFLYVSPACFELQWVFVVPMISHIIVWILNSRAFGAFPT